MEDISGDGRRHLPAVEIFWRGKFSKGEGEVRRYFSAVGLKILEGKQSPLGWGKVRRYFCVV